MDLTEIKTISVTSTDLWEKAQKVAQREGRKLSNVICECLEEYIKIHGDGNPQYKITQFHDEMFKATPAVYRKLDIWSSHIDGLDENNQKELESQIYGIKTLIDKKRKYGTTRVIIS